MAQTIHCCCTTTHCTGTGLQGQAVFRNKLTFRPHSTDSQTHRKMTLSIADRFSKAQKIRVLPAVGRDPETDRLARIKVNIICLDTVYKTMCVLVPIHMYTVPRKRR